MSKWGALQLLRGGKKNQQKNTKHLMKSAIKCGCFFSSLTALRHKEELITEKKEQETELGYAG